jgi:hypothetical protein
VVTWPSSFHKAAETSIGYNLEWPFILRHPTDNFSPTMAREVRWKKVVQRYVSYLASVEVC